MRITILLFLAIALSGGFLFSQCTTCTTCSITTSSGCTWTVSSSSSTDYEVNSGEKLCITGGTYTGDIEFGSAFNTTGGTVVVSGGTFKPASISIYTGGDGGILEIKSAVTATVTAISTNGSDFTFNNCGTVTLSGNVSVNGGTFNYNNEGTITGSTRDFSFNGAGTVCNGGTMTLDDFTANGTSGSAINNRGTLTLGDLTQNSDCPINICNGSLITVNGNFTSNGGLITGVQNCGAINVVGSSTCTGCELTGPVDFCDYGATQPASDPTFNSSTGATIAAAVTQCKCSALPIDLLYFSAQGSERSIIFAEWITVTETNNDYFLLEKSKDGVNYETAGTIKGAGNSSSYLYYSFPDENPFPGVTYYRLKQVDFDGQYKYYGPVAANLTPKKGINLISLFPNPATGGSLQYLITSENDEVIDVIVYDFTGKTLVSIRQSLEKGMNNLNLDVSAFTQGNYLVRFVTDKGDLTSQSFSVSR